MQQPVAGPRAEPDHTIPWPSVSSSGRRNWWPVGVRQNERRSSVGGLGREGARVQHFHCSPSRRFLARGSSSGHRGTSDYWTDTAGIAGAAGRTVAAAGTVAVAPAPGKQWWGTYWRRLCESGCDSECS